jgi:hypothetical protein
MKLQELAVTHQTKQVAKVFESYFSSKVQFDQLSRTQATQMLERVRALVSEHRRTPEFHHSEKNSAYLKLIMMEQALAAQASAPMSAPTNPADAAKQKALLSTQVAQKKRQIQDQIKMKQQEIVELQKQMNMPTMAMGESRLQRSLREASEVQQAQVVLASQDMVDQVQKMIEQITAMQFKDLPALVDQIKNEIGVEQSAQFNTDATAALAGLVQNLQGSKTQLETALGVVTGQAPVVPGDAAVAPVEPGAEIPAELPAPDETEIDVDAEMDANLEPASATLGRGRR